MPPLLMSSITVQSLKKVQEVFEEASKGKVDKDRKEDTTSLDKVCKSQSRANTGLKRLDQLETNIWLKIARVG